MKARVQWVALIGLSALFIFSACGAKVDEAKAGKIMQDYATALKKEVDSAKTDPGQLMKIADKAQTLLEDVLKANDTTLEDWGKYLVDHPEANQKLAEVLSKSMEIQVTPPQPEQPAQPAQPAQPEQPAQPAQPTTPPPAAGAFNVAPLQPFAEFIPADAEVVAVVDAKKAVEMVLPLAGPFIQKTGMPSVDAAVAMVKDKAGIDIKALGSVLILGRMSSPDRMAVVLDAPVFDLTKWTKVEGQPIEMYSFEGNNLAMVGGKAIVGDSASDVIWVADTKNGKTPNVTTNADFSKAMQDLSAGRKYTWGLMFVNFMNASEPQAKQLGLKFAAASADPAAGIEAVLLCTPEGANQIVTMANQGIAMAKQEWDKAKQMLTGQLPQLQAFGITQDHLNLADKTVQSLAVRAEGDKVLGEVQAPLLQLVQLGGTAAYAMMAGGLAAAGGEIDAAKAEKVIADYTAALKKEAEGLKGNPEAAAQLGQKAEALLRQVLQDNGMTLEQWAMYLSKNPDMTQKMSKIIEETVTTVVGTTPPPTTPTEPPPTTTEPAPTHSGGMAPSCTKLVELLKSRCKAHPKPAACFESVSKAAARFGKMAESECARAYSVQSHK